jgi:hypothetical protein
MFSSILYLYCAPIITANVDRKVSWFSDQNFVPISHLAYAYIPSQPHFP